MRSAASRIGAVVLGGDYVGLGIVRSLGRRGVPICIVDDERSISRYSRYAPLTARISDLGDADRSAEQLLKLEARLGLGGWVLFPTRDETVAMIASHHDDLSERFRVTTPAWPTFRWAWDKEKTYELARRVGVPAPRTWRPRDAADLDAIDAEPPFVIKPAVKPRFLRATKKKAWLVRSRGELAKRYREAVEIAGDDPILVQEHIPGVGEYQLAYCALYGNDGPLASMAATRIRQHPMDFGRASTYVRTVELPEIEALSRRVLDEIGYRGLVEIEFKRDPRTAELKLLDINARAWGYHSLGAAAGVDFPWLLYSERVGAAPAAEIRARPGVSWMRALTDLPTAALEVRAGRLSARTFMRQLLRRDAEAVFSAADPGPGVAELVLIPYLAERRGF